VVVELAAVEEDSIETAAPSVLETVVVLVVEGFPEVFVLVSLRDATVHSPDNFPVFDFLQDDIVPAPKAATNNKINVFLFF